MKLRAVLLMVTIAVIFSFSVVASVSAHQGTGLKFLHQIHHHK